MNGNPATTVGSLLITVTHQNFASTARVRLFHAIHRKLITDTLAITLANWLHETLARSSYSRSEARHFNGARMDAPWPI